MKPYKETHQQGRISIEKEIPVGIREADVGIQIASDGRIWVCVDGIAFIRFTPFRTESQKEKYLQSLKEAAMEAEEVYGVDECEEFAKQLTRKEKGNEKVG